MKTLPRKYIISIFLVFLLIVLTFWGGFILGKEYNENVIYSDQEITQQVVNFENVKATYKDIDLNMMWNVWNLIGTQYLDREIDNEEIYYGAIKGIVNSLNDPYTSFLTPDEVALDKQAINGQLEGIGVTLRQEDDYVIIETVVDGFPAFKNGIKSNDIILKVDDNDMQYKSAVEAASLIRGKSGTKVTITIFRPSDKQEYKLDIIREKIDIDNITLGDFSNGIQTIKIYRFTEGSVDQFNQMWDKTLNEALRKNPKGIIIDLRGNPGGFVSGVEHVLEDFIPKGKIIFMEEDRNGNRTQHKVNGDGKALNIPMVVLVNGGSASASEIFAGAIQDHKRGSIIGEATVGKGVEQKIITLTGGSQLNLVFQKWLTPNGKNINREEPIKPDYLVEDYKLQIEKAYELLK